MAKFEIPSRLRPERRQLITLYNSLPPGGEISFHDVYAKVGLDIVNVPADKQLDYQVRKHCTDLLRFVVTRENGKLTRETDIGVVTKVLPKRQEKLYRAAKRGIAESQAIAKFDALPRPQQLELLARQSIIATVAVAAHQSSTALISTKIERSTTLAPVDPNTVIKAATNMQQ